MRKLEKYLCLALFGYITIVFCCICFAQGKTIRGWLPCQNTNPGRWRRNWTRTPTIPQSDLRSWSATNKEVLRKSQRGKYQERNSSTGITHELHCVCTKWLNQMTQGRASSATNRPKSDLLGSKSEEIQMKNTHGTLWLDQLILLNWTTNWKLLLQKLHSSWCVTQQTWGRTSKTFFWIPISQTNNQGLTSIFRRLLEISLICNNDLLVAIECFFVITELQGCSLLHVKWLVQSRQEWGPETYWNSILQKLKSHFSNLYAGLQST